VPVLTTSPPIAFVVVAIVVDSYAKVKSEIEEDESERSLLWDLGFVHMTEVKRRWFGWPTHEEAIARLNGLKRGAITFETTKGAFPGCDRAALRDWLLHYHKSFEHLQRQQKRGDAYEVGLLDKVSYMLDKPVPSILDVLKSKKKSMQSGQRLKSGATSKISGGSRDAVERPESETVELSAEGARSTTRSDLEQRLGQTRERNQDWSSPSSNAAAQSGAPHTAYKDFTGCMQTASSSRLQV
jgi:hypothetical protein